MLRCSPENRDSADHHRQHQEGVRGDHEEPAEGVNHPGQAGVAEADERAPGEHPPGHHRQHTGDAQGEESPVHGAPHATGPLIGLTHAIPPPEQLRPSSPGMGPGNPANRPLVIPRRPGTRPTSSEPSYTTRLDAAVTAPRLPAVRQDDREPGPRSDGSAI